MILQIIFSLTIFFSTLYSLQPSELSFFYEGKAGEVIPAKIILVNEKDIPELVDLKIVDYSFNADGEVFFEDPTSKARSSSNWIELSQNHFTIPAKDQVEIHYKIHIPENNELNGSYWNVILIEPKDIIHTKQLADGYQINVKIRYAYHVVIDLGKGKSNLKILNKEIIEDKGKKYFKFDVLNDGETFLKPKLSFKVFDESAQAVKTLNEQPQRLYPLTSFRYKLDVNDLSAKKYFGFIILDSGNSNFFGDRVEFTLP